jgi:hypothetical protein
VQVAYTETAVELYSAMQKIYVSMATVATIGHYGIYVALPQGPVDGPGIPWRTSVSQNWMASWLAGCPAGLALPPIISPTCHITTHRRLYLHQRYMGTTQARHLQFYTTA